MQHGVGAFLGENSVGPIVQGGHEGEAGQLLYRSETNAIALEVINIAFGVLQVAMIEIGKDVGIHTAKPRVVNDLVQGCRYGDVGPDRALFQRLEIQFCATDISVGAKPWPRSKPLFL